MDTAKAATTSTPLRSASANKEQVDARIAELTALGNAVPEHDLVAFEELKRLEDENNRFSQQLRNLRQRSDQVAEIDALRTRAEQLLTSIASIDCNKAEITSLKTAVNNFDEMAEQISFSYPGVKRDDPWQNLSLPQIIGKESPQALCIKIKQAIAVSGKRDDYLGFISRIKDEAQKTVSANSELTEKLTKLVELIQKRRALIQKSLTEKSPQQQVFERLWIVIAVIGLLSLTAIFMVKLFPEPLQLEWISSGQLIQFVTVMILLSVVMALGLGNILKEQTLGTLLGGIAGYVLSQGVGLVVARETTRRIEAMTSQRTTQPSSQSNF